jgi:hypothetical protein
MTDQLALSLPDTATFDDWSTFGAKLLAGRRKLSWLIGDWLIAGMDRYGDQARDEAVRLSRTDIDRFGLIVDVCRRFPEDKRHAALTFDHHAAVARLDDERAASMLDDAERLKLPVLMLRAQVRETRISQGDLLPAEDDDPEDREMRAVVQSWNRARPSARRAFLELAEESHMGVIDL